MSGLAFLSYLLAGFGLLIGAVLLGSVRDAIADRLVRPVLGRLSERARIFCMIVPVTIVCFGAAIATLPG